MKSTRIVLSVTVLLLIVLPLTAFAADPVAWWPGNGNAYDAVGTYNGSLRDNTTFGSGQLNQAFSFDGSGDYVICPNTLNIDGGPQATYMAWVNPATAPGNNLYTAVMSVGDSTQPYYYESQGRLLYWNQGGTLRFYAEFATNNRLLNVNGTAVGRFTAATSYSANNWYFVVAVFNNGTIDLYVNGSPANGSYLYTNGTTINTDNTNHYLSIGAQVRTGETYTASYFNGLIDEVAIYNTALNSSEITDIYNNGIQLSPANIPTMNEWGMVIFMCLLSITGFFYMRRKFS